jgi:plastocyanin
MSKVAAFALSAVILVVGISACGSSSSSKTSAANQPATTPGGTPSGASTSASTPSASTGGGTSIAADPSGQLKYDKTSLSAKSGKVTFTFTNSSSVPHNFTIQQGTSGAVVGATPTFAGGNKTLSVKLKPGTYTFFCSVPGHRQAGMQGTLTVK